jgi:hypothetical protein
MSKKRLKVNFNKGGNGGVSAKLTLPITMVRELGIDEENDYCVNDMTNAENRKSTQMAK